MSVRVRGVVWLGLMFFMGLIAISIWTVSWLEIHPFLMLMLLPFAAGILTMWVWSNLRVGIQMGGADRAKREGTDKYKRPDFSRLTRLVEDLDEDEAIELETLLLSRRQGE